MLIIDSASCWVAWETKYLKNLWETLNHARGWYNDYIFYREWIKFIWNWKDLYVHHFGQFTTNEITLKFHSPPFNIKGKWHILWRNGNLNGFSPKFLQPWLIIENFAIQYPVFINILARWDTGKFIRKNLKQFMVL